MSAELAVALVLCVVALGWLIAELVWVAADSKSSKLARFVLLLGCGLAFYLFAFPPVQSQPGQTLVVLTAGAEPGGELALAQSERLVALPEFDLPADSQLAERAPDLASALRRFPAASRLRIIGDGLSPRDLAAAAALPVEYSAAASQPGIVDLRSPSTVVPGALWAVGGRVVDHEQAQIELLDPQQSPLARSQLDADGRFELFAHSPIAGLFRYQLRLLAADGETLIEQLSLPLQVETPRVQRILLFSRAPNAEQKYLRRWAVDSGQQLSSSINLRPRLSMRLGSPQLSADALAQTDLLILDDRSWYRLSSTQRSLVAEAVEAGLGLLLRLTDEPNQAQRRRLAEIGFAVAEAEISRQTQLPALNSELHNSAGNNALQISRRLVKVEAASAVPLLTDSQGSALGLWRAQGDGRVGLLWVGDTYGIFLKGEKVRYASLWANLLGTLARAQDAPVLQHVGEHHWVDQRIAWCARQTDAVVIDPGGETVSLLTDEYTACAGYWPRSAGWHRLRANDLEQPFYVRAADDGVALRHQQLIASNLSLAAEQPARAVASLPSVAGPRWPWFLLWLALSGSLWWLERRATTIGRLA